MMKYVALSEVSGWPKPDKILDETGREWLAWGRLAGNQNLPASQVHPDGLRRPKIDENVNVSLRSSEDL